MTSGGPPAVDGTTSLIGRSGNACALCNTGRCAISATRTVIIFCFIRSLRNGIRRRAMRNARPMGRGGTL